MALNGTCAACVCLYLCVLLPEITGLLQSMDMRLFAWTHFASWWSRQLRAVFAPFNPPAAMLFFWEVLRTFGFNYVAAQELADQVACSCPAGSRRP